MTPDDKTDMALVRRFVAGDEQAFGELTERHRTRLYSVARRILRDECDAQEIVQDAFVRAYRNLATFRGESSVATWLCGVTKNLAFNRYWYWQRRKRHLTHSLQAEVSQEFKVTVGDTIPSDATSVPREAELSEFDEAVIRALHNLPSTHRDILRLRYIEDTSYSEIARKLSLNEGTVKSRLTRARAYLHQAMESSFPLVTSIFPERA